MHLISISKLITLVALLLINCLCIAQSQDQKKQLSAGIYYGFGSEIQNRDYTYTNSYYKLQISHLLKKTKWFEFEVVVAPEINFATHQLLNLHFIIPSEENYQEKRDRFTQIKNIREYILNVGFIARKPINSFLSVYALASVGPMISDTETERLSKGFAFSDVIAMGITYHSKHFSLDIRPGARHLSNAGLQERNAGINTKNIEFAVNIPF